MTESIQKAVRFIEDVQPTDLHVEELEGMMMLYADKEQATPYISPLDMFQMLLGLIATTGFMRVGQRLEHDVIHECYTQCKRIGWFEAQADQVARDPERSLNTAILAREFAIARRGSRTE